MTNDKTRQLLTDYRTVFQSSEGQRVLADLMRLAGLFDAIEDNDPIAMAQKVGKQNLIKEIITMQGVGLDVYINTLREGGPYGREFGATGTSNGTGGNDWI